MTSVKEKTFKENNQQLSTFCLSLGFFPAKGQNSKKITEAKANTGLHLYRESKRGQSS